MSGRVYYLYWFLYLPDRGTLLPSSYLCLLKRPSLDLWVRPSGRKQLPAAFPAQRSWASRGRDVGFADKAGLQLGLSRGRRAGLQPPLPADGCTVGHDLPLSPPPSRPPPAGRRLAAP